MMTNFSHVKFKLQTAKLKKQHGDDHQEPSYLSNNYKDSRAKCKCLICEFITLANRYTDRNTATSGAQVRSYFILIFYFCDFTGGISQSLGSI